MPEEEDIASPFCTVPNEMLFHIITFLPTKDLIKCRQICIRWKLIIDRLAQTERFWVDRCKSDFNDNFLVAKQKARHNIPSFYLYRSLCLWSKLTQAEEETHEIVTYSRSVDRICGTGLVGDGILGVCKQTCIEYYNTEPEQVATRESLHAHSTAYCENDFVLVIRACINAALCLLMVLKEGTTLDNEIHSIIENVKWYLLRGNILFYVTFQNKIYVCNVCRDETVRPKYLNHTKSNDSVMALSFSNDCLNVLTFKRSVWTISANNEMTLKVSMTNETNILDVLHKYNFLNELDWCLHYHWLFEDHDHKTDERMKHVVTIRSYGDTFFAGSKHGVLSIYYRPFINGELDLFHSKPAREITLKCSDIRDLHMHACLIRKIDVMETKNGHIVFVAMGMKVIMIKYTYKFLEPVSWMVSPCSDIEEAMVQAMSLDSETFN